MKPLANTGFVIICPLQATNPLATTVPNINLSSLSKDRVDIIDCGGIANQALLLRGESM